MASGVVTVTRTFKGNWKKRVIGSSSDRGMGFLLTPLPHLLSLEELTRFMLYTTRKLQKSVYTPKRQLGYKTAMASHAVVFRGVLSGPPLPVYREGYTTPLKMTAWEAISEGKKNSP